MTPKNLNNNNPKPKINSELIYYRLGEMEKKLDEMISGAASTGQLMAAIEDRNQKLNDIKNTQRLAEARITKLENFNSTIVGKIAAYAVGGLVMMVLALYGLDKLF